MSSAQRLRPDPAGDLVLCLRWHLARTIFAMPLPSRLLRSTWAWLGLGLLAASLIGLGLPQREASPQLEIDTQASAAAKHISDLLQNDLEYVEATARDWQAAALDPTTPEASRWLQQARGRIPGAAWVSVTNPLGVVLASPDSALRGAYVAERAWFRRGLQGPAILPARDPQTLPAQAWGPAQAPERVLDLVAPLHNAAGLVVGVLAAHVPESTLAASLHARAAEAAAGHRLVVLDATGAAVVGFGRPTSGLAHSSGATPLARREATAELDWRVRLEAPASTARRWGAPDFIFGLAALLLATFTLKVMGRGLRVVLRAGPGWRARWHCLCSHRREAIGLLAAGGGVLLILSATELYSRHQAAIGDQQTEDSGRALLAMHGDFQASSILATRHMHTLLGLLTAALQRGDQVGFADGMRALQARIQLPDLRGGMVMGLAPDGSQLWQVPPEARLPTDLTRFDLGPIIRGEADLAYGLPQRFAGRSELLIPVAGAVRDAEGRLLSISVAARRAASISASLALIQTDTPLSGAGAAQDLIALVRADGFITSRSDLQSMPGAVLPADFVAAVAAANGGVVVRRPGEAGGLPGRLVLARQALPNALVAVVSLDLDSRQAEYLDRRSLQRGAACALAALLLLLTRLWLRAGQLRKSRDAAALAATLAERDIGFLRALTNNLQEALAVVDAEGRVRFYNDQALRMFGAERMRGAIGRGLAEMFVAVPEQHIVADRLGMATAGGKPPPRRYAIPGPDGQPLIFEGRIWALSAEVQGVLGGCAIATAFDITEHAAADAARQEAEARVAQLLAAMPGVLLEIDISNPDDPMRVTWCSASAERLLGSTPAEVLAPGWWRRLTPGPSRGRLAAALPALRQGSLVQDDIDVRLPDGRVRRFNATTTISGDGQSSHIATYLLDVTEARANAGRLVEMARSQFLVDVALGVSHEINQPLSSIVMGLENTQTALRRLLPEEKALQGRMQRVIDQALRIGRMTEEFRTLRSKPGEYRQSVDLAEVIRAVIEVLTPEAAAVGVGITLDMPAELPPVLGQAVTLHQAVAEAIRAAITAYQAASDGKTTRAITLAVRLKEAKVVVTIDDGAGPIPDAYLNQIFVPFAPIRTWAPSGGLGLAKCWQAMLAVGGQVEVANIGAGVSVELQFDRAAWASVEAEA